MTVTIICHRYHYQVVTFTIHFLQCSDIVLFTAQYKIALAPTGEYTDSSPSPRLTKGSYIRKWEEQYTTPISAVVGVYELLLYQLIKTVTFHNINIIIIIPYDSCYTVLQRVGYSPSHLLYYTPGITKKTSMHASPQEVILLPLTIMSMKISDERN